MSTKKWTRAVSLVVGGSVGLSMAVGLVGVSPASAASYDKTSALEKARVDAVPTPKLGWYDCYGDYQCTTATVPLDYDDPKGPTTELALLKYPAQKPKKKIGTLFVNPGGPGGQATALAYFAPYIFSDSVLDRFDVVGVDPRGVGFSESVQCFASAAKQAPVLDVVGDTVFPDTAKQQAAYEKAAITLGKACATTGQPLASSMSTAETARDMDVMRRAVGDKKLTYLGFSYGTYLGQVYANLFPDRVRALALDGVLDPVAWQGNVSTQATPIWERIRSAEGASKALTTALRLCDQAGGQLCTFAPGNPQANLALIASRLKKTPLEIDYDDDSFTYGYPELEGELTSALYDPDAPAIVTSILSDLIILTEPPAKASTAQTAKASSARKAALKSFVATRKSLQKASTAPSLPSSRKAPGLRPAVRSAAGATTAAQAGFPYDNDLDAFVSVGCSDSVNSARASQFPALAAASEKRTPYVGALRTWQAVFCASDAWSARDEDAYAGSFTHRTVSPLLFVGDYYDPATNYDGAVKAAALAPNSRLLSSDSWGHTAYGTSDCVTSRVDDYLLKVKLPKKGKVCEGDIQPFTGDDEGDDESDGFRLLQRLVGGVPGTFRS